MFDYEVKFEPVGMGLFQGRATNTTRFGVGEEVNFIAKFNPPGITTVGIEWDATGMNSTGASADQSTYAPKDSVFKAGAFPETNTVIGTLISAPSAGKTRTNLFVVLKPTDAVLRDLLLITTNNIWLSDPAAIGIRLVSWPNVGHTNNTMTCSKRASYFLEPPDVSFHGITVREGTGSGLWDDGLTNMTVDTLITNASGVQLFWVTNGFPAHDNHPTGMLFGVSHPIRHAWGPTEPNYWCYDTFRTRYDSSTTNLPVFTAHVPRLIATLTLTIAIEFNYKTTNLYAVTNVFSLRDFYTSGRVVIRKAGSGPHLKEYSDPDSPE